MNKPTYYLLFFILSFFPHITFAQNISGVWTSEDHSRIYKTVDSSNMFNSYLLSSKRPNEFPGECILKDIVYNKQKKRYEGLIHSLVDGSYTFAEITVDGDILTIRLRRLFVSTVTIRWKRV